MFTVDVDYVNSYDSYDAGRVVDGTTRIVIQHRSDDEAMLLAAQMVIATGRLATETRLVL